MNPLSQREQRRKSGDVTIEHLRASGRVGSGSLDVVIVTPNEELFSKQAAFVTKLNKKSR